MQIRRFRWARTGFGALVACVLLAPQAWAAKSWSPTGSMANGRSFFSATRLPNSDVLVAGGFDGTAQIPLLSSAEIYHPSTGTWTTIASMNEPRAAQTALRLPDGRVMVIGGENFQGPLASAEIYDPVRDLWTETAPMLKPHDEDFVATLLPGTRHPRVLVAGGFGPRNKGTADSEIYDVGSNTWQETGHMNQGRGEFDWARLPGGRILVAGGIFKEDVPPLDSAEIYDPRSGSWTLTGSLNLGRFDLGLVRLPDGRVLAAGGGAVVNGNFAYVDSAELWNPSTGTWTVTGSMISAHSEIEDASVLLRNGTVLVTGGFKAPDTPQARTETYDPASGTWSSAGDMSDARAGHHAVRLSDGSVLAVGGLDSPPHATPTADLFD